MTPLVLLRVVWTEEVRLEVKLEKKKVLPEDGAELLDLLDLLLLLLVGEVLVASALTLPFISPSLPLLPRAELANEPIPPIMADHGLLKLDVLALAAAVVAAEGEFNSDADVDVDDAAVALVATTLPSLLVTPS
jgi:hypothetical protein